MDHVWNAVGITVGRHAESAEAQLVRDEAGTPVTWSAGLEWRFIPMNARATTTTSSATTRAPIVLAHAADDNDQPRPFKVSMSFDEAHAYLEGDDQVYTVDVPPELYRWTEAYVIANYFPEKNANANCATGPPMSRELTVVNSKGWTTPTATRPAAPGSLFCSVCIAARPRREPCHGPVAAPGWSNLPGTGCIGRQRRSAGRARTDRSGTCRRWRR